MRRIQQQFVMGGVSTLMAVAASIAGAATFTANGGSGSSTIGPTGDYASLAAAAADFNGAQAVTGDYTFFIQNGTLTEAANVGFGKNTNGFTVTLKPEAGASPIIDFTATADNNGPTGNLVIGCKDLTVGTTWDLVPTNNFVIDGSNTNGGTSQDLTIRNGSVTFNFSRVVAIAGDSNGSVIKNCKIINRATAGTTPAAVAVGVRRQASTDLTPDNWIIRNNVLQALLAGGGMGIDVTMSGTPTAGVSMAGWTIEQNTIESRQRGIYLNNTMDGTIQDNSIAVGLTDPGAGLLRYGIYYVSANSSTNRTGNVRRNRIHVATGQTATGNFGAIGLAGVSAVGTGCTLNTNNNMIHCQMTAASVTASIRVSGTDIVSTMNHNFYNNSIYLSATGTVSGQAVLTGTAAAVAGGVHGIGVSRSSTTPVFDCKNNLVRNSIPGGAAIERMAATGTFTSNFNDLSSVTSVGGIGTTAYATLGDWQGVAGTPDLGSFSVNPLTTTGSAWSPSGVADLHFTPATTKPVGLNGVTRLASITTDIDGDARSAVAGQSYVGADEIASAPLPVSVSAFEIE